MGQNEYIKVLDENLLEYYIDHNDGTWKFLHDNALIHCSYSMPDRNYGFHFLLPQSQSICKPIK